MQKPKFLLLIHPGADCYGTRGSDARALRPRFAVLPSRRALIPDIALIGALTLLPRIALIPRVTLPPSVALIPGVALPPCIALIPGITLSPRVPLIPRVALVPGITTRVGEIVVASIILASGAHVVLRS